MTQFSPPTYIQLTYKQQTKWFGSVTVECQTCDCKVVGSTPGQIIIKWMGNCLWTGKPSRYITNTKVTSAVHPSGVGKSSTSLCHLG